MILLKQGAFSTGEKVEIDEIIKDCNLGEIQNFKRNWVKYNSSNWTIFLMSSPRKEKVLILGSDSFLGNSFANFLSTKDLES